MTIGPLTAAPEAPARDSQETAQVRSAARQFEGLLLQQLFAVMRNTVSQEGLFGEGGEMYAQMFDQSLGNAMADSGGVGLARVLEQSMGLAPEDHSLRQTLDTSMHMNPIARTTRAAHGPPVGAALPGATGALQASAAQMIPSSGVAPQWGREGVLTARDLASPFATESAGGTARFTVRDARGFEGYLKCNLFALELARRAGFEVPVQPRARGWGYPAPEGVVRDAEDGAMRQRWSRVATGATASSVDEAIVSGRSAFLLSGAGSDGHAGHMGVIERVHEIAYDADGRLERIVFDGWEGRTHGASHVTQRTWNRLGNPGGENQRNGFERIELLELARPTDGVPERPLHPVARPSVQDAANSSSSPGPGDPMVSMETP